MGKVKFVFKSSGELNICGNNNNNIRMLTIVTFHDKTSNNSSSLNLGHRLASKSTNSDKKSISSSETVMEGSILHNLIHPDQQSKLSILI